MFLQLGHFSHSIGTHIRGNLNFVEAPTNPSCQDTGERHKTKGWDGLGAQRGAFPAGGYLPGIMRDHGVPSMGELWIFLIPAMLPGRSRQSSRMARDALILSAGISWHKAHFPGWEKSN